MTYATATDVATRLGRPSSSPTEGAQWDAWLEDVEAFITSRLPDLADAIADGRPSLAVVTMVEANAVIRKIKNPDGKQNERIDDYSYGLNADARRGELFLTDAEWDLLMPSSPDGAFTIRPAGHSWRDGQWVHPDVWVPAP